MTITEKELAEKLFREWTQTDGEQLDTGWDRVASRAAVTAYLDHAHPEVTSVTELDALPVSATVLCAAGWPWIHDSDGEGTWWWVRAGREEGFTSEEIPLPARVIHWGP